MHEPPTDWMTLCGVVLLLGLRHGLDADHLATIDAMTRLSRRGGRGFSRYCGALFSLGHGAVVLSIAAAVGLWSDRWAVPAWLDAVGGWISVSVLGVLGIANLLAALRTAPHSVVNLVGFKTGLFGRIAEPRTPWAAAAVGALFAFSFDTLSQAALFGVMATRFGGTAHALALGGLFVLGMLLVDGLNGWWVAHLIARADRLAAFASRLMAFAVGAVSLGVAGIGAARLMSPRIGHWTTGHALLLGVGVVLALGLAFVVARLRPTRPAPGAGAAARSRAAPAPGHAG